MKCFCFLCNQHCYTSLTSDGARYSLIMKVISGSSESGLSQFSCFIIYIVLNFYMNRIHSKCLLVISSHKSSEKKTFVMVTWNLCWTSGFCLPNSTDHRSAQPHGWTLNSSSSRSSWRGLLFQARFLCWPVSHRIDRSSISCVWDKTWDGSHFSHEMHPRCPHVKQWYVCCTLMQAGPFISQRCCFRCSISWWIIKRTQWSTDKVQFSFLGTEPPLQSHILQPQLHLDPGSIQNRVLIRNMPRLWSSLTSRWSVLVNVDVISEGTLVLTLDSSSMIGLFCRQCSSFPLCREPVRAWEWI